MLYLVLLVLFFQSHLTFADINENLERKKIAITIDDVPMPSGQLFSGMERSRRIINTLKDFKVDRVGLFIVGGNLLKDQGEKRLNMYDKAGHMISNHTYSHPSCSKVSAEDFIKNIYKCHKIIKKYNNFQHFFRYPYLDVCKGKDKKSKVRNALENMGYKNAYVTIDTLDYYINRLLQEALQNNQIINYDELKKLYLEITFECITSYSEELKHNIGHHPIHNLLLHENDINALYLGDIITFLRQNGWEIVSPEEALVDQKAYNTNIDLRTKIAYIKNAFENNVIN